MTNPAILRTLKNLLKSALGLDDCFHFCSSIAVAGAAKLDRVGCIGAFRLENPVLVLDEDQYLGARQ
jgi:hypothetical protein